MKITAKTKLGIYVLAREIGYRPETPDEQGETSMIRALSPSGFPRFHIYAKAEKQTVILNLHLDQKKPSYGRSSAHSGEYEGELVEREVERIKNILGQIK